VAAEAANARDASNQSIQRKLDLPLVVINHVLFMLERQRKLTLSKSLGNSVRVVSVSAELKRALRQ
jgi:hypothetical protein